MSPNNNVIRSDLMTREMRRIDMVKSVGGVHSSVGDLGVGGWGFGGFRYL